MVSRHEVRPVHGSCSVAITASLSRRHDMDRCLIQVPRSLRGGYDDRRRAIGFLAAVEKVQRLDDPTRVVVVLQRQRTTVHDGPRIVLGVFVRSQRDSSEVVLSGSELVHVTLSLHRGEVLGGGHDAERHAVCSSGGDPGRGSRLPESSELALGEAAICNYVVSVSGDDCGAGVRHCS